MREIISNSGARIQRLDVRRIWLFWLICLSIDKNLGSLLALAAMMSKSLPSHVLAQTLTLKGRRKRQTEQSTL